MNPQEDDPDPLDEESLKLLAAYDDGLLSADAPPPGPPACAPLPSRFERTEAVLRLLAQAGQDCRRQARAGGADDEPAEAGVSLLSGAPRRLGRFELRRELGQGGCGIVFLAFDPNLRREVALKVPRPGAFLTEEMRDRFLREAWAAAALDHPNVVPVYEAGEAGAARYIASAYCPGPDLARWLAVQDRPVAARLAAELVAPLADAVEHAHGRGVFHRDLKPSNVLLEPISEGTASGQAGPSRFIPKITDFGLAKLMELEADETKTGALVGTASYMAPEQAAGKTSQVGAASDVYALGAILYEMLAGRPPFQGETQLETLQQVQQDEPVAPRRLRPGAPQDLETICLKCLEKEPRQRYPRAQELAADLRRFLGGETIRARRTGPLGRGWRWCRRNPWLAGMAAAVIVLVLLIAVVSTVSALWLRAEQRATVESLRRATDAERAGKEKLWDSYVALAGAGRLSGRSGQRLGSLSALTSATELLPELGSPGERTLRLRNEAIACMVLHDLTLEREWEVDFSDPESSHLCFDAGLQRCAWLDRGREVPAIVVCRLTTDERVARFPPPGGDVRCLRFGREGGLLAAGIRQDRGSSVHLWDLNGLGKGARVLPVAGSPVEDLDFGPGNQSLVATTGDGSVCVFDVSSGDRVRQLSLKTPLTGCRFSPDGRRLAVWGGPTIRVLDLQGNDAVKPIDYGSGTQVVCVDFSPDGAWLAAGGSDHFAHVWDLRCPESYELIFRGHQRWVRHVAFSRSGESLVTASSDGTTRLWDSYLLRPLVETLGFCIQFSEDERHLAGIVGSRVARWKLTVPLECRSLRCGDWGYIGGDTDISPDGRLMVACWWNGVDVWDWVHGRRIGQLEIGETASATFHPQGTSLVTCGNRGVLQWRVRRAVGGTVAIGPPRQLHPPTTTCVRYASFSRDGRILAVGGPGQAAVIEMGKPAEDAPLIEHAELDSVSVHRDGFFVATAATRGRGVRVWDTRTGKLVVELMPEVRGTRALFTPDGRWLVTGTKNEHCFWQVPSWRLNHRVGWPNTSGSPGPMACALDSGVLAVSYSLFELKLLDPQTGREFATLPTRFPDPWLSFDPQGCRLACTGLNLTVDVWDLQRARHGLAELGLDWEMPSDTETPPKNLGSPLRLEVVPATRSPELRQGAFQGKHLLGDDLSGPA